MPSGKMKTDWRVVDIVEAAVLKAAREACASWRLRKTVLERVTASDILASCPLELRWGLGERRGRTEPPQKRHPLQTALRRNTTILGKHSAQHQHIQLALMIAHKHHGPHIQRVLAAHAALAPHAARDVEPHARRPPHGPLEHAPSRILRAAPVANEAQEYRCADAVGRAAEQEHDAGYAEGEEGGELCEFSGEDERREAQEHCYCCWSEQGVEEPAHGASWYYV